MKLYYDDILLGNILTNHSMSIDDALESLEIDMDEYAREQGWDGWEWESLRMDWSENDN